MLFRTNLLVGALALIAASGAMAYDKGTKGTAMQNIEDRPNVAPQVTQSVGPVFGTYDRGTKATAMQNITSRNVAPVNAVTVAPAEVAAIRTQRAAAADVSFQRGQAVESPAVQYKAVKRYDRGTKGTAMQNIQNQ